MSSLLTIRKQIYLLPALFGDPMQMASFKQFFLCMQPIQDFTGLHMGNRSAYMKYLRDIKNRSLFPCNLSTQNAGLENSTQSEMKGCKTRDWKMRYIYSNVSLQLMRINSSESVKKQCFTC